MPDLSTAAQHSNQGTLQEQCVSICSISSIATNQKHLETNEMSTDEDNEEPKKVNKPFLSSTYVDRTKDNSNLNKHNRPTSNTKNTINKKLNADNDVKVISVILYMSNT